MNQVGLSAPISVYALTLLLSGQEEQHRYLMFLIQQKSYRDLSKPLSDESVFLNRDLSRSVAVTHTYFNRDLCLYHTRTVY